MKSLAELPSSIVKNIIDYLPQQEILNLALTNYRFYEPCLQKLYKKVCIRIAPILKPTSYNQRGNDFLCSTQTVVYGIDRWTSLENQYKMISVRLQSLIASVSLNTTLIEQIEEISVFDSYSKEIEDNLATLVTMLSNSKLKKLLVADHDLGRKLNHIIFECKGFQSLESLTIYTPDTIEKIIDFPSLKEMIFYADSNESSGKILGSSDRAKKLEIIAKLTGLSSITVCPKREIYRTFINLLLGLYSVRQFRLVLKRFSLCYIHELLDLISKVDDLGVVEWKSLKELELAMGCDDDKCNQDCLLCHDVFLKMSSLSKLSITQYTEKGIDTHKFNEIWDINVFDTVKELTTGKLVQLSLRHAPCESGVFSDGMEGNYLHRIRLYAERLPELVDSGNVRLILPNFVKSLSCYEQAMNNLLWNGCRCQHCEKYLTELDEFMMSHRFYNFELKQFRDLTTSNMFVTISEWLSRRFNYGDIIGDLYYFKFPMCKVFWDFHSNLFSIPFRCSAQPNIEEYEFDEEVEVFYDAPSTLEQCAFNAKLFSPVAKCISHYTDDLIARICDLYRGNAEDVTLDSFKDLNDGTSFEKFTKVVLNGINYSLDKEVNGTNYFESVYD